MAKLYFRYGAMGSSKSANAVMVRFNYLERGQKCVMLKPRLDVRDGEKLVASRCGLTAPCEYIEYIDSIDLTGMDCVIVGMPSHIALFSPDAASGVMEKYEYKKYYRRY